MKIKFEMELLPNGMWKVTGNWSWLGSKQRIVVYAPLSHEALAKADAKFKSEWARQ